MKKTLMLVLALTVGGQALAQTDAISRFFNKYADDESFTLVTVSEKMFSLFAELDLEDQADQELVDAVSKVKGLKVLARENLTPGQARALYKEAYGLIPSDDYEELMSVRDADTNMKFLIREKDGIITELFMVMHGNDNFVLLSLVGDIDLKQISRLSKSIKVEGFEHLEKVNEKEKH